MANVTTLRNSRRSMASALLGLIAGLLVLEPVVTVRASVVPNAHGQHQTKCKNDGHKYIFGKTATAHCKKAKFVGTVARLHPSGDDGGYIADSMKTLTLILTPASKITVFKNAVLPDFTDMKTVTAAHFPHSFRRTRTHRPTSTPVRSPL
jgi:hypothetical protein